MNAGEMREFVESGRAVMGIELGSTRIKAVLVDGGFGVIAQGAHDWENRLVDGVWSYALEDAEAGVRDAYAKCAADVAAKCGARLGSLAALGISGMMHGYLAFDAAGRQLVPFRTWRNVMTADAAARLSGLFGFNIPQRWSVAHCAQAILNGEAHVPEVRRLTTLAGYVHARLSGEAVLGVGEASGMFPVDPATGGYDERMMAAFESEFGPLADRLPRPVAAGGAAGRLTEAGARWLDPTGTLRPGAVMAPPEGDAGTGMVATNAVAPRTGNVSAGTSIFAMVVLDGKLGSSHPEVDVVTTPAGREVAMVHCNNCTNEINAWKEVLGRYSFRELFEESLRGDADCGGVTVVPYLSGEPVTGVAGPMLRVVRSPGARFTLANFMRAQVYSAFVSLRIGMEILAADGVRVESLTGHGGIFKDRGIAQQYLADALRTPVTCLSTASEGGPWGMAVLAEFARRASGGGAAPALERFLADEVFAGVGSETLRPTEEGAAGFDRYAENFRAALAGRPPRD